MTSDHRLEPPPPMLDGRGDTCPRCGLKVFATECLECYLADRFPAKRAEYRDSPWRLGRAALVYQTVSTSAAALTAGAVALDYWVVALVLGSISAACLAVRIYLSGCIGGIEIAQEDEKYKAADSRRAAYDEGRVTVGPARWLAALANLPTPNSDEGYIYAIKFGTGCVKVGKTVDPRRRFSEHRRDANVYGVTIEDVWISPRHTNYDANETRLIAECASMRRPIKREYFQNVDYAAVVAVAKRLNFTRKNTGLQMLDEPGEAP